MIPAIAITGIVCLTQCITLAYSCARPGVMFVLNASTRGVNMLCGDSAAVDRTYSMLENQPQPEAITDGRSTRYGSRPREAPRDPASGHGYRSSPITVTDVS